ncbi:hypothetical protein EVJ58_g7461 [Rhodofomes roseus]|uniref:F-box domain-containing protein n=1 Tax=Rhodofomes roseus TaxID=34475 RepID=A0A4Y9Y483_9APHY|nr:hypothetical protein EVJ58_g7461 [Rhodofomes roseus]
MEDQAIPDQPAIGGTEETLPIEPGPAAEAPVETPPKKKARRSGFTKKAAANAERPPCHLTGMPVEILAEILSYIPSPATILALARCSKYLCNTLVNNPSTAFVWREARKRCAQSYKLPEPTPNFTEASYAAFVFDGGKVCEKPQFVFSQGSVIQVGTAVEVTIHPRYKEILAWLPRLEAWDETSMRVRKHDWQAAVDEYNRALLEPETMDEFLARKQAVANRLKDLFELSKKLKTFSNSWETRLKVVREANEAKYDFPEGWTAFEMMGTPTYGLLHRSKTAVLEVITSEDFALMRDQVDKEIAEHKERGARRRVEAGYQKRREDVAAHYTRLKSAPAKDTLPTLPEFRKLSVMKVLQGKASDANEGIRKELKNSKLVHELLSENLQQWREDARGALAGVLGFAGWKSASKNKLHPVDRLTARFLCKKCVSKGKGNDGLDFAAACEHRCAGLNKKQRARETWNANLFQPDTKAIDTVNEILVLIGTNAEDPVSKVKVERLEERLLCTACPAPIAMSLDIAIRHCKRHDNPTFEPVSGVDARLEAYGTYPIPIGLAARLLKYDDDHREERAKKVYACRHCQPTAKQGIPAGRERESTTVASTVAEAMPLDGIEGATETPTIGTENETRTLDMEGADHNVAADHQPQQVEAAPESSAAKPASDACRKKAERQARKLAKEKLYIFDGLRSHLKEKHGILRIGDEDIYTVPSSA